MATYFQASESHEFIVRLHRILSSTELDCQCRTAIDNMLDRFSALECRRQLRTDLRYARRQRDRIATLLAFLGELDEITEQEVDQSVFEEMASLFDEIGACAANAAKALRDVDAMLHPDPDGNPDRADIEAS